MKKIIFILIFLFVPPVANAQDEILMHLVKKSDIVVYAEILDIQGGMQDESGVQEWTALCRVANTIKGKIGKSKKIRFRFKRYM